LIGGPLYHRVLAQPPEPPLTAWAEVLELAAVTVWEVPSDGEVWEVVLAAGAALEVVLAAGVIPATLAVDVAVEVAVAERATAIAPTAPAPPRAAPVVIRRRRRSARSRLAGLRVVAGRVISGSSFTRDGR
jgi:hypothetical protein